MLQGKRVYETTKEGFRRRACKEGYARQTKGTRRKTSKKNAQRKKRNKLDKKKKRENVGDSRDIQSLIATSKAQKTVTGIPDRIRHVLRQIPGLPPLTRIAAQPVACQLFRKDAKSRCSCPCSKWTEDFGS